MSKTGISEIEYSGRKITYQAPLGIYLDEDITGRIHDAIIPKYHEVIPEQLASLKAEAIKTVRDDAIRQLKSIAQKDTTEVRQSIKNTIDLATKLLE